MLRHRADEVELSAIAEDMPPLEDDTDEAVSQAILKQSEMSEQMQAAAIEVAAKAVAKGGWDNEIAARIKKEMDKKFQSLSRGAWHCIVGPDFGSYVTHEAKHFIYFYLPRGLSPQEKAKGGASAQGQQKMVRPPPRPAARAARPAARAPPMFCSRRTAPAPRAPPTFRSRRTRALPAGWRTALPHVACKKKLQILDSVHISLVKPTMRMLRLEEAAYPKAYARAQTHNTERRI